MSAEDAPPPGSPQAPGEYGSTAKRITLKPPALETAKFHFVVTKGPDAGSKKSLTVQGNEAGRVFIGKSEACDLKLADALVSRRHAAIEFVEDELRITDLDSTNGTFVNGLRVMGAFLVGGETLQLGDTFIEVERARERNKFSLPSASRFGRLLGASREMRRLYPVCEKLALSDVPIILEGETGTGKELLAEAIHEASPRAAQPFVVFDCTTHAPTLIDSALFGHERGAFTGADAQRVGVFEQANGGTLLVDEIGDLDLALQSKLLRAVQSSQIQRVGGSKWIDVDVRLIVATRRDLEREIQAGRFRDDLYYRLAVARIELPPLRHRRDDIVLLAEHFWVALGGSTPLPADFQARLLDYSWPGNVRELHNAVAHRHALGELADERQIWRPNQSTPPEKASLTAPLLDAIGEDLPFSKARQRVLENFEKEYVARVLDKHGGNVTKAAAASGIARRYFYVIKSRQER